MKKLISIILWVISNQCEMFKKDDDNGCLREPIHDYMLFIFPFKIDIYYPASYTCKFIRDRYTY